MRGPLELMDTFQALWSSGNVTYLLTGDLRIVRTNPAWETFARANGGEELLARWRCGSSVLDVIPDALRPFYEKGFAGAARTDERWEHEYECSSVDLFRKFRMIAYPFSGGLVVTHALLVESPHVVPARAAGAEYSDNGLVIMCGHCRRVRAASSPERWDWVPGYVGANQARISHGLCAACASYYYGVR